MGSIEFTGGEYAAAREAYQNAIKYGGDSQGVYEYLALLYAVSDDLNNGKVFFSTATKKFPSDATIWFYLAVFANRYDYHDIAKLALNQSEKYGYVDEAAFAKIRSGQPYTLSIK